MSSLMKSVMLISATVFIIAGIVFGLDFVKEKLWINNNANDWQTFTSETFGFSVNIPSDWVAVEFPSDEIAPRVNMYPARQRQALTTIKDGIEHISPITHHSPILNVSVFPNGVPTEGFFGEFIPSEISFNESVVAAHDFVLKDGSRFATFASFANVPSVWNESGFVWAYAIKKDTNKTCLRNGARIAMENCDPLAGDTVVHSARMSERDREVQKKILLSFTFAE